MKPVITRIWHGITKASDADAYLTYLQESGIPGYKKIEGNLSVEVWRNIEGDICHFCTVTKWDSLESIKKFAGEDYEKAVYYPDDKQYLLEFEEQVKHFETFVY
jgi:heme-degrading monooxygenase HmoA